MIASLDKEHHRDSVKYWQIAERKVMPCQFFTTNKMWNCGWKQFSDEWFQGLYRDLFSKIIIPL